ncbi:unnamed protein product, partial [Rotaria magnacalcarata]
MNVPCG